MRILSMAMKTAGFWTVIAWSVWFPGVRWLGGLGVVLMLLSWYLLDFAYRRVQ